MLSLSDCTSCRFALGETNGVLPGVFGTVDRADGVVVPLPAIRGVNGVRTVWPEARAGLKGRLPTRSVDMVGSRRYHRSGIEPKSM